MATVTLLPNANPTVNTGWIDNGGNQFTRVITNDGDTTNIYSPIVGSTVTYPTESSSLTTETINSLTVTTAVRPLDPNANATTAAAVYIGGNTYFGTSDVNQVNTSYTLYTYTWTTNPATGLAWTISQANAAEVGITKVNAPGERCTYINKILDYTGGVPPTPQPSDVLPTQVQVSLPRLFVI